MYGIVLAVQNPVSTFIRTNTQLAATAEQLSVLTNIEYALNNWPLVAIMGWFLYVFIQSFRKEPTSQFFQ